MSRVLRAARIIFDGANCGVDCVVRELTAEGGLCDSDTAHLCPDYFHLKMLMGETHSCVVTRRTGREIDFKFASAPADGN